MPPVSVEEARLIAAAVAAELRATALAPAVTGPLVSELADEWMRAHGHLRAFATDVGRSAPVLAFFGGRAAGALRPGDADEYRARRGETVTRLRRPPSVALLNRELGLLHRVLNFAVSRERIAVNPMLAAKLLQEHNVREVVIDEAGIEAILRCIENRAAYAWTILAFESGMRRGEIMRLCWRQLKWQDGVIVVPAAHTKTRRPRVVEFPQRSREAARDVTRAIGSDRVFTNPKTSEPYNARWMYELFVRAVVDSGVVGIDGKRPTWHDLRRSYATLMRRRGVQESVVMKFTGHADPKVFRRYNIVGDEDLAPAMLMNAKGRVRELRALRSKRRGAQKSSNLVTGILTVKQSRATT